MNIVQFIDGVPQTDKKLNGYFELKKKQPRNGRFLAKYWKLCSFLAEHIPHGFSFTVTRELSTKDDAHELFKDLANIESVSFSKLTEEQFSQHYSNALDVCCSVLGSEKEETINQLTGYF